METRSLFLCLMFFKEKLFTNFASLLVCWLSCLPATEGRGKTKDWGLSSVGLERMLDRHEVAGSNPVDPT